MKIMLGSTARNCDNSQKFSVEVVELIRMRYNASEEFCDNSQKFSVEEGMMIWKLRETFI